MILHRNTVSDNLWDALILLMSEDLLSSFRLVGGTSLSLQMGHRMSVDIDMFTDSDYDSIDFRQIDEFLEQSFPHVEMGFGGNNSLGKSYFVGTSRLDLVKLDFFYTDAFVFPMITTERIRLASKEEIIAMKLEIIGQGGRKKDFWDLYELMQDYSLLQMIQFYGKRYPYGFSEAQIIANLTSFEKANDDFDPICLRNHYWELIKIDFEEKVKSEFNT
jgi:hypothetical protein